VCAGNRLHRLVYAIGFLGILHYYIQSKADVSQPVIMSGFFFWLMGYRLMARYGYKDGLVPLAALTVAAALLTVIAEAAWYGLTTGVGASRVLLAKLGLGFGIRPAWWVLAAGLSVTLVAELRRRMRPAGTGRRAAAAA
jgi:sulfoxide reductase heme-binding subunit YedZ